MENLIKNKRLMPLFALICALLWGCGFSVVKTGYELFGIDGGDVASKILFAGIRFILAGLLTLVFCAFSKTRFDSVLPHIGGIVVLSIFQTVIQYAFLYIALANLSGSNSSVLNQLGSFLLVLLLPLTDKNEHMSKFKLIGCILGFAGLVYINLDGLNFSISFAGEGCIIISSCSAAVGYIISGRLSKSVSPVLSTGLQQLFGGVILTATGLISGGRIAPHSPAAIPVLVYLAFSIAAAYVIWSILLKYNPVSEVTIYKFAVPVFGVLVSGLLLGENILQPRILISLAAVATGILLVNLRAKSLTKRGK
ncbi:MAG: DMT family transporter [Clostridiales bacterium]|nr:DMT family transporter [Clostridiales bacterium]